MSGSVGVILAVLARPHLWRTAIRQARLLMPRGWWKQRPFLPVPARAYVAFRTVTQYGNARTEPEVYDVIDYLEWCKDWHSTSRDRRG